MYKSVMISVNHIKLIAISISKQFQQLHTLLPPFQFMHMAYTNSLQMALTGTDDSQKQAFVDAK